MNAAHGAYLDTLDALLREGLSVIGPDLAATQADFVIQKQRPDGGFPGRLGDSDLYYTDFAVRVLSLVGRGSPALPRAATYLSGLHRPPRDVVECFSLLNCIRLLGHSGHPVCTDTAALRATVLRQALPPGGFGRPGSGCPSAYHTFVAALCLDLLGERPHAHEDSAAAISALQTDEGGFAEEAGQSAAQTSATAAAVGYLTLAGAISSTHAQGARRFLSRMQAPDGGLRAHAGAASGDLLSTFTGLVTLAGLGALDCLDLPAVGRFLRDLAAPGGGLRSCRADPEADIEYTYYGLGVLAVLGTYLGGRSDLRAA